MKMEQGLMGFEVVEKTATHELEIQLCQHAVGILASTEQAQTSQNKNHQLLTLPPSSLHPQSPQISHSH